MMAEYFQRYFWEVIDIARDLRLDRNLQKMVDELVALRKRKGRLFILGLGGSASNASHMVNDVRKLCGIEAYAPTDNISEFSARVNDDGPDTVFLEWLRGSNLNKNDAVFVLSVGGGAMKPTPVSPGLVHAIKYANTEWVPVLGICGRKTGYLAENADVCIVVPEVNPHRVTPHSEAFQAIIWHALVSHPDLQVNKTKW